MLENVSDIFFNYPMMISGRVKKAEYKKNMYDFRVEFGEDIQEMVDAVNAADNKEEVACSIGTDFCDKVFALYEKKGKVKGTKRAELNMFMILYIFPAILLTGNESATLMCDKLRDAWNIKFGEKIDYTDYDTIYEGFREKIFGMF